MARRRTSSARGPPALAALAAFSLAWAACALAPPARVAPASRRRVARGVLRAEEAAAADVPEDAKADFVKRLELEQLVDDQFAAASARVRELADRKQSEELAATRELVDDMLAEAEAAEMKALRDMEDQVEFLVGKVATRERAVAAAVEDARRVSDEAAAFEQQSQLFSLGSGVAAVALVAAAYAAASQ